MDLAVADDHRILVECRAGSRRVAERRQANRRVDQIPSTIDRRRAIRRGTERRLEERRAFNAHAKS